MVDRYLPLRQHTVGRVHVIVYRDGCIYQVRRGTALMIVTPHRRLAEVAMQSEIAIADLFDGRARGGGGYVRAARLKAKFFDGC